MTFMKALTDKYSGMTSEEINYEKLFSRSSQLNIRILNNIENANNFFEELYDPAYSGHTYSS